jgi:Cu(I)/Ag(I) efflux system protein CusF
MRLALLLLLLAPALLAACTDATPDAQPSEAAAAETRSGHGTGTVTAVDAGAGTVTIAHGPMPDVGWSAMTMTFAADPTLLAGVAEGDAVAFDLTVTGGRGTITALAPR